MQGWIVRALWVGLLASGLIAAAHALSFVRDLPSAYSRLSPLSLEERRRLLHEDGFMELMEAARRAFPEPRTVAVWVPEANPEALADLVRAAERWYKAAYYLYPHRVLPLGSAWALPDLAAVGLLDPALLPLLEARYLPLSRTTEPLGILAFHPRLPDRLESLLVDQTDVTSLLPLDTLGSGTSLEQLVEIPVPEAWLSSLDIRIEGWTSGERIQVEVRDGLAHSMSGQVVRSDASATPPERFVFAPPVPVRSGRALLRVSHLGGGDGTVQVRGRRGRLWLRAFAAEPEARPLALQRAGTLFVVEPRGTRR